MGRITICLEDETEKRMRQAAKAADQTVSQWVAALVQKKTSSEWPEEVRNLAGAWADFPYAEDLRK